MNIITRQTLARDAAGRWHGQYFRNGAWRSPVLGDAQKIHERLMDLGLAPNPEDVDRVIGNDSWTRNMCSCCSKYAERVVSVDVTSGEYSTHICEKCVGEMKALFT